MLQASALQVQLFSILDTLRGLSIDYENIRDLGKLDVNCQRVRLNKVDCAVAYKVAIPVVCLLSQHPLNQSLVRSHEIGHTSKVRIVEQS